MNLKNAILATLVYSDIFAYPLTEAEIWRFLIGKKIKFISFRQALASLLVKGLVATSHGYFFLKHRQKLVRLRTKRQKIAQQKNILAKKAATILKIIPGIWYIGISGSLALNNSTQNDDIDFFIITAPFDLWRTRMMALLLLDAFGMRRKIYTQKISDKICLNMFLDARKLSLPLRDRNLYIAHEIAQLKTVVNKNNIFDRFLQTNIWVKKYLPHTAYIKRQIVTQINFKKYDHTAINQILKELQLKHMQNKITTEKISDFILQFHPQDKKKEIETAYETGLKKLGIDKTPGWFIK
jgi:predicted nucleotidyltransferase